MKAKFKVELLPPVKDGMIKRIDSLCLTTKDRQEAAILIDAIHRKISNPRNEEINIYLVGEYERIEYVQTERDQ